MRGHPSQARRAMVAEPAMIDGHVLARKPGEKVP
jgi:hypothetical protein